MKILSKFINELDCQKVFIRHFLDSMDKSRIICEKLGSIRILNLSVDASLLSVEVDRQLLENSEALFTPIVSFYSNLNKCQTVDVTQVVNHPNDFGFFMRLSAQIKRVINPLVIVFLGQAGTFGRAREFAEKVNYCFLDGKQFCEHSRLESHKYFADSLHKFVFQTRSENVVLHLDVCEFQSQWQILLFSLKPIIKAIFVNDSFQKLNSGFFNEFKFDGKLLQYSDFKLDFHSLFFKEHTNQFIVFDGDFPSQLSELKSKRGFVVLDCRVILDIIARDLSLSHRQATPESRTRTRLV